MEWKPYDTAPKEGLFLVYISDDEHEEVQVEVRDGKLNMIGHRFAHDLPAPTLWTPIIKPEKEDEANTLGM